MSLAWCVEFGIHFNLFEVYNLQKVTIRNKVWLKFRGL